MGTDDSDVQLELIGSFGVDVLRWFHGLEPEKLLQPLPSSGFESDSLDDHAEKRAALLTHESKVKERRNAATSCSWMDCSPC